MKPLTPEQALVLANIKTTPATTRAVTAAFGPTAGLIRLVGTIHRAGILALAKQANADVARYSGARCLQAQATLAQCEAAMANGVDIHGEPVGCVERGADNKWRLTLRLTGGYSVTHSAGGC